MADIKCHVCKRALSSSGKEIGLVIFDPDAGWINVCATERCSGVPEDVKVSELQNYWLGKELSKELGKGPNSMESTYPLEPLSKKIQEIVTIGETIIELRKIRMDRVNDDDNEL